MQLFTQNALLVLKNLAMLYVIVAMGIAADRLKWFPEQTARTCTKLLLYVITPCVVLKSFLSMEYSPEMLRDLAVAAGGGVLLHTAGIFVTMPWFRGKRCPDTDPILHYAAMYSNCGYMSLPLAQAILGNRGVFYVSIVVLTFQMFSFTHGEFTMNGGGLRRQGAGNRDQALRFDWKRLFINAGVLSVAVGLPLYLLRVPVPDIIKSPIESVAAMNTPMAMVMFGAYLSRTKFNSILRNKSIFTSMGIKLFVMPAVLMSVLLLFGVRGVLLNALLIPASAPCANNTVVFAAKYDRDAGYAAQVVALFSFISVVTMPLMIAIGMSF